MNTDTGKTGTMQVYDVASDTLIEVTVAEAAAGLVRYARTLGPGTPVCGGYEERAVALVTKS